MNKAEQVKAQTLVEKLSSSLSRQPEQSLLEISQQLLQNEPLPDDGFSDGIENFEPLNEEAFLDIGSDEWLQADALDIEQAQYVQVAENTYYPSIYDQVEEVQSSLPAAKVVESGEIITTSTKLPYILIGSGLLLSGLTVAAAGGHSSGSDNDGVTQDETDASAVTAVSGSDGLNTAATTQNTETANTESSDTDDTESQADTAAVEEPAIAETETSSEIAMTQTASDSNNTDSASATASQTDSSVSDTASQTESAAKTAAETAQESGNTDSAATASATAAKAETAAAAEQQNTAETTATEAAQQTTTAKTTAEAAAAQGETSAEETQTDKTVTEQSVVDNTDNTSDEKKNDTAAVSQSVSAATDTADTASGKTETATAADEENTAATASDSAAVQTDSTSDTTTTAADTGSNATAANATDQTSAGEAADSAAASSAQNGTSTADSTSTATAAAVSASESTVVVGGQTATTETVTTTTTETTVSGNTSTTTTTVTDGSGNTTVTVSTTAKESGLTLDIAKHFYSADVIKQYIDVISAEGGTYLQLHLSDDDNYAFESKVLNQLVSNATLNSDGTYTNNATGKQFLSFEQIADIAAYAKEKGVELIPEVDTPNHMDAIFKLLELYQGTDYVNQIKSEVVDDEIDITSDTSIAFVQSLYSEVIDLMDGSSKHFHIGGDEFGYSADNNYEFISYANEMAAFLETQGLTTRMWNDGILKTSLASLDKDIEITYWSYDGNTTDSTAAAERREERASMDDLLDNGFDVLNYNWYYLYFVPTDSSSATESGSHMASDIQSTWELGLWDGTTESSTITDTGNIIGASLTIWGEYASSMTDDEIFASSVQSLTALISKVNSLSVDTDTLSAYTLELSADTAVNEIVELDSQLSSLVNISMTSEISESGNSFVWLNGSSGDIITLTSDWTTDGTSELKDNVSYTLYKSGQNHLYIDTDIVVAQV